MTDYSYERVCFTFENKCHGDAISAIMKIAAEVYIICGEPIKRLEVPVSLWMSLFLELSKCGVSHKGKVSWHKIIINTPSGPVEVIPQ